jgi:hypothetical protein
MLAMMTLHSGETDPWWFPRINSVTRCAKYVRYRRCVNSSPEWRRQPCINHIMRSAGTWWARVIKVVGKRDDNALSSKNWKTILATQLWDWISHCLKNSAHWWRQLSKRLMWVPHYKLICMSNKRTRLKEKVCNHLHTYIKLFHKVQQRNVIEILMM